MVFFHGKCHVEGFALCQSVVLFGHVKCHCLKQAIAALLLNGEPEVPLFKGRECINYLHILCRKHGSVIFRPKRGHAVHDIYKSRCYDMKRQRYINFQCGLEHFRRKALARHLLGQPSRVTATVGRLLKDYITLDDNAVIVMQWPRAIAISEASWTQIGHLTSYVTAIYGSEGTLLVEPGAQGRVLLATRAHEDGVPVDVPPAPEEMRNATAFFLSHIVQGKPIKGLCSAEVGRDAQEILEAGLISAAEGTAVSLPLPPSYL